MEDYKQKYEQAFEKAKEVYNRKDATDGGKLILESMFPDLKESNDEKIRKGLIQHLKELSKVKDLSHTPIKFKQYYDVWISWLEKQCEQKLAWSEEDEKILNLSLENLIELKNRFGEKYGKVGDCIHWFESLKERMGE